MLGMQAWSIRPQWSQPNQGAAGQERQQQVVAPGQPQVQVRSYHTIITTLSDCELTASCMIRHVPVVKQMDTLPGCAAARAQQDQYAQALRCHTLQNRMAKESASAKASPTPVRFVEKHAYAQPPAKEPQAAEAPLEPMAGVPLLPMQSHSLLLHALRLACLCLSPCQAVGLAISPGQWCLC